MTGHDRPDSELPDPDAIDELLRARLRSAAPAAPDAAAVDDELAELTPRFRRARQRRQTAVAAVSSAAAAALLVVGAVAIGGTGGQRIDTADDDRTSTTTTSTTVPATTIPTTTTVPGPTTVPTTVVPTVPDPTAPSPGGNTATVPPPSTAPPVPPTTAPVGGTQTLSSEGGNATVRWNATSITVIGTAPAVGWQLEEIDQRSPTRVVVDFRRDEGGSGTSTVSIDARVVDGQLDVNT